MRTRDIKTWVHHSSSLDSPYDSDDDMKPESAGGSKQPTPFDADDALHDWAGFAARVEQQLRTPSTRARLALLQGRLPALVHGTERHRHDAGERETGAAELTSEQREALVMLLLDTFNRYQDKASRQAAQHLVARLMSMDEERAAGQGGAKESGHGKVVKGVVAWLHKETESTCRTTKDGTPRTARNRRANLAQWASSLYASFTATCMQRRVECSTSPCWDPLVRALASAYDAVVVETSAQSSVVKNTTVATRRAIRTSYPCIPALLHTLTSMQTPSSVPLLGLVADVCLRLRAGAESAKGTEQGKGRTFLREAKSSILSAYIHVVVCSKTPVPFHVRNALHDFIAADVTEDELESAIRPTMEKMMLRSPDIAMPTMASFFEAFTGNVGPHLVALKSSLLSASKSTSPNTRQQAVSLFQVLAHRCQDTPSLMAAVEELLGTLKGGKASPEQRTAIYAMLAHVEARGTWSPSISKDVVAMLAKESQETAMRSAMDSVTKHLTWCLEKDDDVSGVVGKALCKELENAKVPLRKIVCMGVGEVFWRTREPSTATARALAETLLPGWEANLKNASTGTLTSASGPLEGYVAVAVLVRRIAGWGLAKADAVLAKNAVLQTLTATNPKPSFLLHDKVIRKVSGTEEEIWLLRALDGLVARHESRASHDDAIIASLALCIIQVTLSGKSTDARRESIALLHGMAAKNPALACKVLCHGMTTWLLAREAEYAQQHVEGADPMKDHSRELKQLMLAVASLDPAQHSEHTRLEVLKDLFVFAHHSELGNARRQCFLDLCSAAKVDPRAFVDAKMYPLLSSARLALSSGQLREASLSTLR